MAKEGLYKKLVAVLGEVDRIPKNGRNEHFKYDYVMEADLVDHIRPLLVKYGLLMLPSVEEATQNGNLSTVRMRFRFVDAETGDFEDIFFDGQGQDTGDKGYYKAYTGAGKYVLMKTFLVATGDDPERDEDSGNGKRENGESAKRGASKPAQQPVTPPAQQKPTEQPQREVDNGTAAKGAIPPTSKDWTAFWMACRELGLGKDAVHREAGPYFRLDGVPKSLNDVPGLTGAKLQAFAEQLKSIVGQVSA